MNTDDMQLLGESLQDVARTAMNHSIDPRRRSAEKNRWAAATSKLATAAAAWKRIHSVLTVATITGITADDELIRLLADQPEGHVVRGCGCPCEPSGSDGLRCPRPDGTLLCQDEATAQGAVSGWSAEDAYEQFIAAEVDSAPEALRRLGDWLCNVLDEDQQKKASAMVIGAMMETSAAIRAVSAAAPAVAVDEDAESWIDRAAFCANELLATALHRVEPVRDYGGSTLNHCRWMAEELAAKRVGSETKACRWLGYLQGQLIAWCMSTLECEKDRNLRSAARAAPKVSP